MTNDAQHPIGFIGLGTMGHPIAINLLGSGLQLIVWNRTIEKARALRDAGAEVATDLPDLFGRTNVVVLMLTSAEAVDSVLARGGEQFAERVAGHLIINMGTTSPAYSRDLDEELRAVGARFVEAPVSGQKVRAENRQLIGLLAGKPADIEEAARIVSPACSETIAFGEVPAATNAKFALSVYLGTAMAAFAESVNYAKHCGVDLEAFAKLFRSTSFANALMEFQLQKYIEKDYSIQASISRVLDVIRPLLEDAGRSGVSVPLLAQAAEVYDEASAAGGTEQDVTSIIHVFARASAKIEH